MIVCKVTFVNLRGEIVFDTLIRNKRNGKFFRGKVTGITQEAIDEAPDMEVAQKHIMTILESGVRIVGLNVKRTLSQLKLEHMNIIEASQIFHQIDPKTQIVK